MNRFFISCPLGFEQDLIQEMKEFWPYLLGLDGRPQASSFEISEVIPGGVEIETPLHLGLQINFFSKLAHRVLLRIASFRAKSFPEMKKKLPVGLLFDWTGERNLAWEIAAAKSKLNNEKRIREVMKESGFNAMAEDEKSAQTLFVRVFHDEFTWSLDTSGAHLHFRSGREKQGVAPLRETYAAYCLSKMIGETSVAKLREIDLLDPMAGSGTFLWEAKNLFSPNLSRTFSFQSWRRTPKLFKSESLKNNYQKFSSFHAYAASDLNPEMVSLMKAQLASAFSEGELQISQADVFSSAPDVGGRNGSGRNDGATFSTLDYGRSGESGISSGGGLGRDRETGGSSDDGLGVGAGSVGHALGERGAIGVSGRGIGHARWIIANPPYGERLAADFQPIELLEAIEQKYQPQKIGLLLSQSQAQSLRQKRKPTAEFPFKNSGLAVSFCIFDRK